MIKRLRKFVGQYPKIDSLFLLSLDQNFELLGRVVDILETTENYTFRNDDNIDSVHVDATGGNLTITMPASATGSRLRRVVKMDSSANTVTVDGNGNNISGSATVALAGQWDSITMEPSGDQWVIVAFG